MYYPFRSLIVFYVNRPKPGTSRTGQAVGPVSQDQESTRIDVSLMSQRLPVGRSMVTVTRQEKAVMQVIYYFYSLKGEKDLMQRLFVAF